MNCRYKEKCYNHYSQCDENFCTLALKEINKELQKENAELKSRLEKSVELLRLTVSDIHKSCDICNSYRTEVCNSCGEYSFKDCWNWLHKKNTTR